MSKKSFSLWLILSFILILLFTLTQFSDSFPNSQEEMKTEKFQFEVGDTFGDRDVFKFNIKREGTITVEASWTGTAPHLALILNGPTRQEFARSDGPSPLRVSHNVTQEILSKGANWKVSIVNFSRKGSARGIVKVTFPEEEKITPLIKYKPKMPTYKPKAKLIIVPNVVGMSLKEAKKSLEGEGLKIREKVIYQFDSQYRGNEGKIVSQTQKAGSKLSRGSTVEILYYNPKITPKIPLQDETYTQQLNQYLQEQPRIRKQIGLEIDHPQGQSGRWLYYDNWSKEWKDRLLTFFIALSRSEPLPLDNPLPLADPNKMSDPSRLGYRSVTVARDVYFAQIAHALWLDISNKVPWRLEDWSDNELSYLLSSKVCFSALRLFPSNELYYVVYVGSRDDTTENILHDPRILFQFVSREPEQGRSLIGATPSETGQKLSGWFHDYLHHEPGSINSHSFHAQNPLLEDRLKRHTISSYGKIYVTSVGCWSASSLFADLMRIVNIPVRKAKNKIISFSGEEKIHCGLMFDWQGRSGNTRYLLHTDDLFTTSYFRDPAPAPKGTERGVALWNHVWLDPSKFGQLFSYDPSPEVLGKATNEQKVKYWELGDWLVSSARAIQDARGAERERIIANLKREIGFSQEEAEACWQAVESSVLSYGDGDMNLGYQRLLDGPNSRHSKWCRRTGKCY